MQQHQLSTAESSQTIDFPIWMTIKIGTGFQTGEDFIPAIKKSGYGITYWGNELLAAPTFSVTPEESFLDLVAVSEQELGLENPAYANVVKRAMELGLELCQPEVGPQLRLQYHGRKGEWLVIGMEPIDMVCGGGSSKEIFSVRNYRTGEFSLSGNDNGCLGSPWRFKAFRRWVFVKPRK